MQDLWWLGFVLAAVVGGALAFLLAQTRKKLREAQAAIEKEAHDKEQQRRQLREEAEQKIQEVEHQRADTQMHAEEAVKAASKTIDQAKSELAAREALIDRLLDGASGGIAVLDPSLKIVRSNAFASSVLPRLASLKDGTRFEVDGRLFEVRMTKLSEGFLCVLNDKTDAAQLKRVEEQWKQRLEEEQQARIQGEQAARRAAFLAEAAEALIPVDDVQGLLDRAVGLAAPRLAEGCRITVGKTQAASGFKEGQVKKVPFPGGSMELVSIKPEGAAMVEDLARLVGAAVDNGQREEMNRRGSAARDELLRTALAMVRTPHSPINVQVQTLDKLLMKGDVPSYQTKLIGTPRRHTALLLKMVEDILETASREAGAVPLHPEEVDLAELILDVADGYKQHFAAAECPVEFKVVGPIKGVWDWLRLEQAISNLMTYAIQSGAGRPVRITATPEPDKVTLLLQYYACEAPPEGPALALRMTQRIIDAHGGSVEVESEGGIKVAVTVVLPRGKV